jgi:hypothetical protein
MPAPLQLLLIIVLVLLLIGLLPVWPYASSWNLGWYPSGGLFLLVVLLVVLALMGKRGRTI